LIKTGETNTSKEVADSKDYILALKDENRGGLFFFSSAG